MKSASSTQLETVKALSESECHSFIFILLCHKIYNIVDIYGERLYNLLIFQKVISYIGTRSYPIITHSGEWIS
jgi:hypothetical protein